MPTEHHSFLITAATPPTIETDSQVPAVYIRFKKTNVVKTISHPSDGMHIAIDLDQKGEVVGIEAVGLNVCSIRAVQTLLKRASVEAPNVEFSRARFVATNLVPA